MDQEIKEQPQCPTIFHAPFRIRYNRESDFEPKFVSIGPYFHGQQNLSAMEARKLQFTSDLTEKLPPRECADITNLIERFRKLTNMARACYKDSISLSNDEFLKLLVLDSCFIIRLILTIFDEVNDRTAVLNSNLKEVRSDLLLIENQIPLFFVGEVYTYFRKHLNLPTFPTILELFICLDLPWQFNHKDSCYEAKHLLDLYWRCFSLLKISTSVYISVTARNSWGNCRVVNDNAIKITSPVLLERAHRNDNAINITSQVLSERAHRNNNAIKIITSPVLLERAHRYDNAIKIIPNANELLSRVGIEFKKRPYDKGFGVSFQNGIMSMPSMKIDSSRTTLFVNLVAYENFIVPKYRVLTSYMVLMDALIDTEKDVQLLRQGGIIHNTLSTNKMAATFFNDISNICMIDYNDHFFFELFRDVQKFYHLSSNRRWASLHRNYFDSPWKGISVVAGTILLILSALQTFYTIFSYYHPHH